MSFSFAILYALCLNIVPALCEKIIFLFEQKLLDKMRRWNEETWDKELYRLIQVILEKGPKRNWIEPNEVQAGTIC